LFFIDRLPKNVLFLVLSSSSQHLYYRKLFQGLRKGNFIRNNFLEGFSIPIRSHQINQSTDIVEFGSALVVVVVFKRQCRLKYLSSTFWTSISNQQHLSVLLSYSHTFSEHSVAYIVIFACYQGIQSALVDDNIELTIFVAHFCCIHNLPDQIWELLAHLLND
jgi:hypothetical protein